MRGIIAGAGLCSLLISVRAFAQDSGTNSQDAFGLWVGNESIGLYNETQVRGFNLQNAGNYRIEGNFFTRASTPFSLLRDATTVRIGINALRYDFPSPSGVIEYSMRRPQPGTRGYLETGHRAGSGPTTSGFASYANERFGILGAFEVDPWQRYLNGAGGNAWGVGMLSRWKPDDASEITAFGSVVKWDADPDTGYFPTGDFLPPKVMRGVLRNQPWAKFHNNRNNAGLFGKRDLGSGWKVSGGVFYSLQDYPRFDFNAIEIANASGDYHASLFVSPNLSASSKSGSVLIEKSWGSAKIKQRVVATVQARETANRNGSSLQFDIGNSNLSGIFPISPEPDFTIDQRVNRDLTRQVTAGLGYRIAIAGRVELRANVEKTDYRKSHSDIEGTQTRGESRPWLYSGSALLGVSRDLGLFASYSRGLEESGTAPSSTINRGEVLPAVLATQREIGARYAINAKLSLIAGLFDTRKPTAGIGPDGRFALVGEVRHKGFESSIAGSLTPRVDILAGLMILDASVSGPLVDQKLIGHHAVAQPDHVGLINAVWSPKGMNGASFDATFNELGRAYINPRNTVRSKLQRTLDLGVRYPFSVGGTSLSVRARVFNVFNSFYWQPDASGTLYPGAQRSLDLILRAEF